MRMPQMIKKFLFYDYSPKPREIRRAEKHDAFDRAPDGVAPRGGPV